MELVPPDELIAANAIGDGDFCAIGDSMVRGLIERNLIDPNSKILDIGCGLGRLARSLTRYLDGGQYYGMDINRSSIDWCVANYKKHPNFRFTWFDAYSKLYNANGRIDSADYVFPFANDEFDFVLLTSVFTHMMLEGVANYLGEIARVMRAGGSCYATYFLLSKRDRKHFASINRYAPINGGFVSTPHIPERTVFLDLDAVQSLYDEHRLSIRFVNFGNWSGKRIAGGYQDEIIAVKPVDYNAALERVRRRVRSVRDLLGA